MKAYAPITVRARRTSHYAYVSHMSVEWSEIGIAEALDIRSGQKSPLFLCVNCGEMVEAHSAGGRQGAHFEHIDRNPECPLSHSDSYHYGGVKGSEWRNPDTEESIEGYTTERKYLTYYRNAAVVLKCKKRDNYTCRSCGFSLRVNGRSIVECHHLVPLANGGERVTSVDDLISLCPTCHRVGAYIKSTAPPLKKSRNLQRALKKMPQTTRSAGD